MRMLLLIFVLLLTGCVAGSALVTGNKRPPIDPSLVKIYLGPPSQFEHIGIVKAQAEEIMNQQDAVNQALAELKRQAAKIGANGIILSHTGEKAEGYSGNTPYATGGGYYFYSGTSEYPTLQGDAIFVFK